MQPFDRIEYESRPAYSVGDFQIMIEQGELLSLPFMSEETKINSKGDRLIFKLKIDSVNERLFKKYASSRVSTSFLNILGRRPS